MRVISPQLLGRRLFHNSINLRKSDDLNELNAFYSELFQSSPNTTPQNTLQDDLSEIDQLNTEINELFNNNKVPETEAPSITTQLKTIKPLVIISKSNDPIKNLSLEELVFQNTPVGAKRLMFYINSPCVVIGKNQNPYKEANLSYLRQAGIPLLRRKSGGGTVVHDLGNVNYSYITTRPDFERNFLGGLIIDELNKSGLLPTSLKLNHKSDIVTSLGDLKISGSAFKISKGKSLHHGTMLLDSDLKRLGKSLKRSLSPGIGIEIRCNSVDSIRSKVANLQLPNQDFIDIVTNGFLDLHNDTEVLEVDQDQVESDELLDIESEMRSWEWKFGRTPKFEATLTKDDLKLDFAISKGLITELSVLNGDLEKYGDNINNLKNVINSDDGLRFDSEEISDYIFDEELKQWIKELI